jgi:hypothetical protein
MQRIEILLQPLLGGFAGVDRAAQHLWLWDLATHGFLFPCDRRDGPGAEPSADECPATDGLRCEPAAFLWPKGARLIPKKAKPFQLVPVIALAIAESL